MLAQYNLVIEIAAGQVLEDRVLIHVLFFHARPEDILISPDLLVVLGDDGALLAVVIVPGLAQMLDHNRVAGADVPMPYATNLERAAVPHVENIATAVRNTLNRQM